MKVIEVAGNVAGWLLIIGVVLVLIALISATDPDTWPHVNAPDELKEHPFYYFLASLLSLSLSLLLFVWTAVVRFLDGSAKKVTFEVGE